MDISYCVSPKIYEATPAVGQLMRKADEIACPNLSSFWFAKARRPLRFHHSFLWLPGGGQVVHQATDLRPNWQPNTAGTSVHIVQPT